MMLAVFACFSVSLDAVQNFDNINNFYWHPSMCLFAQLP